MTMSKVKHLSKHRVKKSSGEEGELTITFMDAGQIRIETATLDSKGIREIWLSESSARLVWKELEFHFQNIAKKVEF